MATSQYFGDEGTPSRRFERHNQFFEETFTLRVLRGTFPLIFEMILLN